MRISLFILLLGLFVLRVQAQEPVLADDHELIVQLAPGVDIKDVLEGTDVTFVQQLAPDWNIWLLKAQHPDATTKRLEANGNVALVQPNRVAQPRLTPNDTLFDDQWNLANTGQMSGLPGADIDALRAWDIATGGLTANGDTIVVAVVDLGFDLNHIDLDYWRNYQEIDNDSIDNDGNGYVDDVYGWYVPTLNDNIPSGSHGTRMMGVIGARGDNTTGIAGVNWHVKVMPVAVSQYSEAQVIAAYYYIYSQRKLYNQTNGAKGAFVVATNSSFGIDFALPQNYPLWCAMYDSMGSVGILSVAATSNLANDVDQVGDVPSLCTSDHLIVVTSTTRTDYLNPNAAYGLVSVDIGAPGVAVLSTVPGNGYSYATGTSIASPHVAGAVALLYSGACADFMDSVKLRPDSMALILKNLMLASVDSHFSLTGTVTSAGRLDLYNSLLYLQNYYCQPCFDFNVAVTDVTCYSYDNGAIALNLSGGTPPYDITWSNGDSVENLNLLLAGSYSVTVTDSTGCSKFNNITITSPDEIQTGYNVNRSLDSLPTGSIQVNVVGGVPPYTFVWSHGDSTNPADSLYPGGYNLTVYDANNCFFTDSITVYNDSSVRIEEIERSRFTMYPNPARGLVNFSWSGTPAGTVDLMIFDLSGKLLSSEEVNASVKNHKADVHHLPQGVYFVQIRLNGLPVHYQKLMLQ